MATDTEIMAMESVPPVDAGVYRARVTDIIDETGQFGPQFKFVFTLEDELKDDGSPIEQWGWASTTLTPASKLWKWALALGANPTLGQSFRMSDLIGRECQVFISHAETPTGPKAKLTEVMPAKKPAAAPTRKPAVAAAADELGPWLGPCFVCAKPSTAYDGHGREVCERHMNID